MFNGVIRDIQVGSFMKVEITTRLPSTEEDVVEERVGVVVVNEDGHLLLSLDKPSALSHNLIWLRPDYTKSAIKLGLIPEETQGLSWWLDSSTKILEVFDREFPCKVCKRRNFFNEKMCWWCGNSPQ